MGWLGWLVIGMMKSNIHTYIGILNAAKKVMVACVNLSEIVGH